MKTIEEIYEKMEVVLKKKIPLLEYMTPEQQDAVKTGFLLGYRCGEGVEP